VDDFIAGIVKKLHDIDDAWHSSLLNCSIGDWSVGPLVMRHRTAMAIKQLTN
jgi:hypothetical protein